MENVVGITVILLWETSKAVLRAKIISYSSHKKEQEQENKLEEKIKQLHNSYTVNPTEQTQKETRETKFQLSTKY